MPEKKKIRNDQEWLELIQECRTSGLSDREWCQMHSISINTFKHMKYRNHRQPHPGRGMKWFPLNLHAALSPARNILPVTCRGFQPPPPLSQSAFPDTALKSQTALQKKRYGIRFWRWGDCGVRRIVR